VEGLWGRDGGAGACVLGAGREGMGGRVRERVEVVD
jgi:hypothetical protein